MSKTAVKWKGSVHNGACFNSVKAIASRNVFTVSKIVLPETPKY